MRQYLADALQSELRRLLILYNLMKNVFVTYRGNFRKSLFNFQSAIIIFVESGSCRFRTLPILILRNHQFYTFLEDRLILINWEATIKLKVGFTKEHSTKQCKRKHYRIKQVSKVPIKHEHTSTDPNRN